MMVDNSISASAVSAVRERSELTDMALARFVRISIGSPAEHHDVTVELEYQDEQVNMPEIVYGEFYRTEYFGGDVKFDYGNGDGDDTLRHVHAYKCTISSPSVTVIKVVLPVNTVAVTFYGGDGVTAVHDTFRFYTENGSGMIEYLPSYYHTSVFRYEQVLDFSQDEAEHLLHNRIKYSHVTDRPNVTFELMEDSAVPLEQYVGRFPFDGHGQKNDTVINGNILTRGYQMTYAGNLQKDDWDIQSENNPHIADQNYGEQLYCHTGAADDFQYHTMIGEFRPIIVDGFASVSMNLGLGASPVTVDNINGYYGDLPESELSVGTVGAETVMEYHTSSGTLDDGLENIQ